MVKLTGVSDLKRNLREVSNSPTGKVLDAICAEALEPLRDETNNRAPRAALRNGAVIAKISGQGQYRRTFWVAFRRGIAMRIAHLIELGTAPHSLAKGASRRYGIMQDVPPFHPGTPAEPFFRPAYDNTAPEVIERFGKRLWAVMTSSIRGVSQ